MITVGPRPCRKCGKIVRPTSFPGDCPTIRGRGLCSACYLPLHREGRLADYPPTTRRREDVVEDWRIFRNRYPELTKAATARLMGMTHKALDQALCRARRAGLEVA